MVNFDRKKLGMYLKSKRQSAGLTQIDVAWRVGLGSAQFISNIERGLCSVPLPLLIKLQKLYGVNPRAFVRVFAQDYAKSLTEAFGGPFAED